MVQRGFDPNKHKRILVSILIDICKELGSKLVFKGGTAAMLFYNLPRLSLGLDFDLLESLTKEEIDKIKIILQKYGRLKDFFDKKFTIFFF